MSIIIALNERFWSFKLYIILFFEINWVLFVLGTMCAGSTFPDFWTLNKPWVTMTLFLYKTILLTDLVRNLVLIFLK
jgi:hypothetical protein